MNASLSGRLEALPPESRLYTLGHLPAHLAAAGQRDRLRQILSTFDFLQAKVDVLGPAPLAADYTLAIAADGGNGPAGHQDALRLLQGAIQLSALVCGAGQASTRRADDRSSDVAV